MRKTITLAALLLTTTALVSGCDKLEQAVGGKAEVKNAAYPEQVFWGDTHLHTSNSVDAFGFGTRLGPEEALRFARGEEVEASTGTKAKLARPLDFLVISDHGEGIGATKALYDAPRIAITDPTMLRWYDLMHEGPEGSLKATGEMPGATSKPLWNKLNIPGYQAGLMTPLNIPFLAELAAIRHDIHAHPELAFSEVRTACSQ